MRASRCGRKRAARRARRAGHRATARWHAAMATVGVSPPPTLPLDLPRLSLHRVAGRHPAQRVAGTASDCTVGGTGFSDCQCDDGWAEQSRCSACAAGKASADCSVDCCSGHGAHLLYPPRRQSPAVHSSPIMVCPPPTTHRHGFRLRPGRHWDASLRLQRGLWWCELLDAASAHHPRARRSRCPRIADHGGRTDHHRRRRVRSRRHRISDALRAILGAGLSSAR